MNILTMVSNAVPGFMGGELRVALDLSKGYREAGHECDILTYGKRTEKMQSEWKLENLKVMKIPTPMDHVDYQGLSMRTIFNSSTGKLTQALQKQFNHYDIIHIHNLHSPSLLKAVIAASAKSGKKLMWTVHDDWFETGTPVWKNRAIASGSKPKNFKLWIISRRTPVLRDPSPYYKIISPSKAMATKLREHMGQDTEITVIPNGTPPRDSKYDPASNVFTFIGHLGEGKGILTLVKAFIKAAKQHPEARLCIVGSGPLKDKLMKMASNSEAQIEFTGQVSHDKIEPIYRQSRFLVLPSEGFENCSMTILEAMSYGIPVIASDMGGNPELVADGETGIVFGLGSAEELTETLSRALAMSPEELISMSKASKNRHAAKYTIEMMVEKYIHVFT